METSRWEDRHPALIGRLAGVAGVMFVLLTFLPGTLGGPFFDNNISTPQILDWVNHHTSTLPVEGFMGGLSTSIFVLFVLLLTAAARGRGLAAAIIGSSAGAVLAIDWLATAIYYALADAGGRQQADAGVVALFSFAKSITFADGFAAGMAILTLSLLQIHQRSLPRPLLWVGVITGAYHMVNTPIQLAISHSPSGPTGPIGVVLILFWILAVSITMLTKPIRTTPMQPEVLAPAA